MYGFSYWFNLFWQELQSFREEVELKPPEAMKPKSVSLNPPLSDQWEQAIQEAIAAAPKADS
jgi:hypothetical protein